MNILSFGDFYLGIDKESFTDVSIHLWRIRLECGGPKPLNHGPVKGTRYRRRRPCRFQGD